MNILFFSAKQNTLNFWQNKKISQIIKKNNCWLSYKIGEHEYFNFSNKIKRLVSSGNYVYREFIDIFLLDATDPTLDIRYVLAHAVLFRKPVLCLYNKFRPPHDILTTLKKIAAPNVHTKSYTPDTFNKTILNFLKNVIN